MAGKMNINKNYYDTAVQASSCDDLLLAMYEISGKETGKLSVISPCWKPHKVLKHTQAQIECVSEHTSFSSYKIKLPKIEQPFSWIYCSPGSSNVIDICLALAHSDAEHLLFIGSAGTLDRKVSVGDIVLVRSAETVVPLTAIWDPEQFSCAKFDAVFAEKNPLYTYLHNLKSLPLPGVSVFSTPSILCEYLHKEFLSSKLIQCVEMETYAFFCAAQVAGKQSTAILCISDMIDTNHGLLNRDSETRNRYLCGREYALPQILYEAAKCVVQSSGENKNSPA